MIELSHYEKMRLRVQKLCPLCAKPIKYGQNVGYTKVRNGREICYLFMHSACIMEKRKETSRLGLTEEEG